MKKGRAIYKSLGTTEIEGSCFSKGFFFNHRHSQHNAHSCPCREDVYSRVSTWEPVSRDFFKTPSRPPPPKKGTLFYRTRHHRHYGKPRLDNQFKVATTSIIEEVGHVLNHVGFCLLSYDVISCGLKIFKSLTNPHIL